ncbi:MAG TPA: DinB family protein [Chitinophagaceae bacterium]|nr:DinB family protein [Chitinophagaceae bacterium]
MTLIESLFKEIDREAITTRRMLARLPEDRWDWKPHPKSMTLRQLSTHLAELPGWVSMILNSQELDFAKSNYQPADLKGRNEVLEHFEKTLADGRQQLAAAREEDLLPSWTLRNGEQILNVSPSGEVIRMTFCQIVHHRAQLGVFLRLLDIPIPGSYGPSADEPAFR